MNTIVSFLFFYWFLAPILYYKNVFFSKYLPMSAPISFDNTGMQYDPSAIIQDGTFSQELYEAYSPIFIPITFALEYGIAFASTTAVIVHTFREYHHSTSCILLLTRSSKSMVPA